jgi:hypothetical protein
VSYIDGDGERQSDAGAGFSESILDVRVVERITKQTGDNDGSATLNSGDLDVVFAPAAATEFPTRIPIRLLPGPQSATIYRAMVKKAAIPFDQDGASPELAGVDNCLLAFAHGDMLQRARAYAKAELMYAQGVKLLADLRLEATVQEQSEQRIIPSITDASGELGDYKAGKGYW